MSAQPRITKAGFHALDPLAYRDLEALSRKHLQDSERQQQFIDDPRYTSVNVASVLNGAAGFATSTLAGFNPNGPLVGDRDGFGWGVGTGWQDNSGGAFPDTLTSTFFGPCVIDRAIVVTASDTLVTTKEPITPTTTFSLYGVTSFVLQYQDIAGAWQTIATNTANTLVMNDYQFTRVVATGLRVTCNASVDGASRITSLEAWLAK